VAIEVDDAGREVGIGHVKQHAPGGVGVLVVSAVDANHR
jgi:hypothetical protein